MELTIETIFTHQEELCNETASRTSENTNLYRLTMIVVSGLAIYGFGMGLFHSGLQAVSSAIKLPLLYGISFFITLPAFHFIGLHLGSRMNPKQTLVLCMNGASVMAVLAASFTPIGIFFMLSSSSYEFMILFHVTVLGFCSVTGVSTISRNLAKLREKTGQKLSPAAAFCFPAWMLMIGIVGTQSGWLLRPFIGGTEKFSFFNHDGGNFFEAIVRVLISFIAGS